MAEAAETGAPGPAAAATRRGLILSAYLLTGYLALPLLAGLYRWRVRRGKEDEARRGERFGVASRPRPEGDLVWVHAASVGETNAVLPLVETMAARGLAVLLTTGTVTSAQVAAQRLPAGAVHQYVPFDVAPVLDRFLGHWRPSLAIMVESEIWPAMLALLSERAIPVVVVNGRMSEGSFRGWRRLGASAGAVFGAVGLCLAQSERDGRFFAGLGVRDVRVPGNLKFDVEPLAADEAELARLRAAIGARPVWIAASTHEGEEAACARIHARLRRDHPDLLLVCAPRHPERGPAVAEVFAEAGLDVALRSRGEPIRPGTQVYVADTIGELGLFYRLAGVAFVGGSLVERGGQNPIEPAQLGCAVVSGPSIRNFSKIYKALGECGGAMVAADEDAAGEAIARLLADAAARRQAVAAAGAVVAAGSGALARVCAALEPLLAGLANTAAGRREPPRGDAP